MKTFSHIFSMFILILMMVCVAAIFVVGAPVEESSGEDMIPFAEGWTYEDGSPAVLDDLRPGKELILLHTLTEDENETNLCFQTKNICFTAYADDVPIYDYHPQTARIFGFANGKLTHNIHIRKASQLRITAEPEYGDGTEYFKDVWLDGNDRYNKWIMSRYIVPFALCIIIVAFGTLLFVAGFIYSVRFGDRIQTVSLGLLAVLSGLWEAAETLVLQMLTGNPAAVHFMDYLCLMLIPAPAVHLIASMSGFPKSRAVKIIDTIVIANMLFQVVCTLTGVGDYHNFLTCTHAVIAAGIFATFFLIIRSVIKHSVSWKKYVSIVAAFSILAVSGLVDIVMYHRSNTYGSTFMVGVLLFVLYLGFYEMGELVEILEQNIHTAEMQRLAHTDGLTGLENRLSFGEYEQEISALESGSFIIVQLDINDLKTVNDKFGHSEGDRHITSAARMIKETFGSFGRIFRTGGDEFIAILSGDDIAKSYPDALRSFLEKIGEYNRTEDPPVPLAVACGMAEYRCGEELAKAEVLADSRMYENKKALKAARSVSEANMI